MHVVEIVENTVNRVNAVVETVDNGVNAVNWVRKSWKTFFKSNYLWIKVEFKCSELSDDYVCVF